VGPDAGPTSGDPIGLLDPDAVCSGPIAANTGKHRVGGLQNNVAYEFVLLSVDKVGNAQGVRLGPVTPEAVTDFWEDYHDKEGSAEGGYCFVATAAYGDYDHPYVRVLRDF